MSGSNTVVGRGSDAIAAALKRSGVKVVFGLCGHGDLALLDAFVESGIQFISCHHEQVAVHAADAYYRVSGRPGVVVTTLGPGMTNTVTGLADAALDSSAVMVISGDVPNRYVGLGAYQELDLHGDDEQASITRAVTKRAFRVLEPEALARTIVRAWDVMLAGCPGPVHVHVPLDFLTVRGSYAFPDLAVSRPPALAADTVRDIVDAIGNAQRPVLYLGGGALVARAGEAALRLAEKLHIPIATSMVAQGVLPEDHPLALGFTGAVGTSPANSAVNQADLLIAVGTRFPEMDASSWRTESFLQPARCRLIQIDIEPREFGRVYTPDIAAVADARVALGQIAEAAREQSGRGDYLATIDALKGKWAGQLEEAQRDTAFPMQPPRVLRELRRVLPADAVLVAGVGVRHMVGQHYPVLRPGGMLVASGFSTMGWETGAALGAKVAAGSRPVVGLIGDGAFNSTVSALSTAVAYDVPVVWVVLDNLGYQSIAVYQDRHFGRRTGTDFELATGGRYEIDYVALARSYGADGVSVDAADALGPALEGALATGRNFLVHVPTAGRVKARASGQWDVNKITAGEPEIVPAPLAGGMQ